jgi:hypothetical protein
MNDDDDEDEEDEKEDDSFDALLISAGFGWRGSNAGGVLG